MKTPMRITVLAALAALLLVPASASAEQLTFGSSLAGSPDVMHDENKADTLFFNHAAKNSLAAPASGEILAVRVKGKIVPRSPEVDKDNNIFHTQVLRPNPDGTYTVDSSSQHLYFPIGGNVDDVNTFVPSTQCIKKGQILDFNHIGGWNGDNNETGTKYQIFKRDTSSEMYWFERDQGTNIGATFTPNHQLHNDGTPFPVNGYPDGQPLPQELMMQVVVGTGFDSSNLCEGGLKGYEYNGVAITKTTFTVYDDGVAGARIGCLSGRGYCEGTLRLVLDGVELGSAAFKINRALTTNIDIPLTNEGARIVNTKGLVDAQVVADSHDDIGQQRQTTGVSTLKSARPTPGGFAGTTVRAQNVTVKNGVLSMKATCPLGTSGSCTGNVSVSTQKRVPLTRGSRGKVYKMAAGKFTIAPGKTVRVPLKLTSGGKKVMKKVKKVVTIATVTTAEQGGQPISKRSKLTLQRR
jgi:hypothetical protein